MTDVNTSNDSTSSSNSESSSDSHSQSMADSSTQESFDSMMSSSIDRDSNSQSKNTPSDSNELTDSQIDVLETSAGLISTISAAAVSASATQTQQDLISTPLNDAISKLEKTGDPIQIEKAQTLREANKVNGLAGILNSDVKDYTVESTLEARNKALSTDSVIGGKLARELAQASDKLEIAEKTIKRAGTFGLVAGPLISSASEIAKLDQNANTADKITAGIVGSLKSADNLAVGIIAGVPSGIAGAPGGPVGVGLAATAGGLVADEAWKRHGGDEWYGDLIDEKVAPTIRSTVETGLDIADEVHDASLLAAAHTARAINDTIETGQEAFQSAKNYAGNIADDVSETIENATDYANEVSNDVSNSIEQFLDQIFEKETIAK